MAEVTTKQNSRSTKFLKDFGIYAIGNLGSKVITFLMVPLYTYFVEQPSEYGYFDLCLQFCLLMTPVVTLQLRDGAFRFLLETQDTENRTRIVSFVYRSILFSTLSAVFIALLVSCFYPIRYLWLTIALLVVMAFYEVLAQVTRGLGNNKAFIAVGLIASFGIGIFSLIFVAWLKMGILGIFIANILARLISLIAVETKMKTFSRFFRIRVDIRSISRDLLKYSIPLIPMTLCGLLPSFTDRIFLKEFHGIDQSGLYAIAVRAAGIIHNLVIIFYQTWQENAIQQYNSSDRDKFFSKVFNGYVYILAIVLIGYVFVIKSCPWIVSANYRPSLIYLYPLGLSMVISAIGNYFYLLYQCSKETKRILPSVVIVASLNIILNFIFVPLLGIYGVILTAIISYSAMTIYLWVDTKKYFNLHFYSKTVIPIGILMISAIPYHFITSTFLNIVYILLAEACLIYFLPNEFKTSIMNKLKRIYSKMINKRKNSDQELVTSKETASFNEHPINDDNSSNIVLMERDNISKVNTSDNDEVLNNLLERIMMIINRSLPKEVYENIDVEAETNAIAEILRPKLKEYEIAIRKEEINNANNFLNIERDKYNKILKEAKDNSDKAYNEIDNLAAQIAWLHRKLDQTSEELDNANEKLKRTEQVIKETEQQKRKIIN